MKQIWIEIEELENEREELEDMWRERIGKYMHTDGSAEWFDEMTQEDEDFDRDISDRIESIEIELEALREVV